MKASGYILLIPIIILSGLIFSTDGTNNQSHAYSMAKIDMLITDTIRHHRSTLGNPYITNYQFNLDEQQIWAIEQNSRGEMIFAHRQGIIIYNGNTFNEIKLPSTPLSLKSFEEEHVILVGAEKDYGHIHKDGSGNLVYSSLADQKTNPAEITDLKITENYIYFFSEKTIYRHLKTSLIYDISWTAPEKSRQNGILQLGNQIYISCNNKGLYKLDKEGKKTYIQNSKSFSKHQISFSLLLSENQLLIGTEINKLYVFDGKKIMEYQFQGQKFIDDNQLIGGINLGENHFALSTLSGGVIIVDKTNSKIESIVNNQNGLPDNEIFAMGTDKQGGLWISHGFGLSRLNYRLPVEDYSQYPGYEGNLIDMVEFNHTIYIATTQGVYYLDSVNTIQEEQKILRIRTIRKEKVETREILEELIIPEAKTDEKKSEEPVKKKNFLQRLFEKKDRQANEKSSVSSNEKSESEDSKSFEDEKLQEKELEKPDFDKKKDRVTLKTNVLTISYVFKKVENLEGKCKQLVKAGSQLLVATNKGLYGIEKNKTELILKDIYVNTIFPSKKTGAFYIGSDKGITAIKSEKDKWQVYRNINPSDFDEAVFSIAEDENHNLWIGTGNYIYHFIVGNDFLTKSYEILDFEKENQNKIVIRQIKNQTFFIYARHIYKFNNKEKKIEPVNQDSIKIKAYSRFLISQPSITWFQSDDKWTFLSESYEPETFQVILLNLFDNIQNIKTDENLNLWVIDANNKFYKIHPLTQAPAYIKDFKVYLEKVTDEQGTSYSPDHILIPSEIKSITLNIAAPYYLRAEDVKYQFFISGRMNNWSEWKSSPTFDFLVYPGEYKLKLRAKNIFGDIIESEEYLIYVQSPFWKKPWFIVATLLSLVLLVSLLIFVILKKRERKLQRDNKRLELKVAERTYEIILQKEQIENKNKEITDSLHYASQIQAAIIPSIKIIKDAVDDCFIINKPKDIVSGDFYWTAKVENKLIITAADCTGHGVPGAFLSVLGVTFLNEITHYIKPLQASLILENLRSRVIKSLHQKGTDKIRFDGIDLSMAIIDFDTMELQFAGANNPLYIIRNGYLTEFKGNRMPVGIQSFKNEPFTNHIIEVKTGDKIYMFSDGFTDQFGGEFGKKFLSRNFKTLLTETSHLPMKEQRKSILDAFDLWKGKYEQIDDVLVIGITL